MRGARPKRFPARVYGVGTEPDPRFTFANERTFLAWIRTSLALLASGVAVAALGSSWQRVPRLSAALVLVGAGLVASLQAWSGWMRAERALRLQQGLPHAYAAITVAVAVAVAAVLVMLSVV